MNFLKCTFRIDGGLKHLQICMLDSVFFLQQVWTLHLDVKVKNVQLWISTSSNLKIKIYNSFNQRTSRVFEIKDLKSSLWILYWEYGRSFMQQKRTSYKVLSNCKKNTLRIKKIIKSLLAMTRELFILGKAIVLVKLLA